MRSCPLRPRSDTPPSPPRLGASTMPSVDSQVCSRHPAAARRQQEDCWALEVLHRSQTSEQGTAHPQRLEMWLLFQQCIRHCCTDVPWRQRVDPDAVLSHFLGHGSRHLVNSSFATVVRCAVQPTIGDRPRHAGDQDDAAFDVILDERPAGVLCCQECACDVYRQHTVEILCGIVNSECLLLNARTGNDTAERRYS